MKILLDKNILLFTKKRHKQLVVTAEEKSTLLKSCLDLATDLKINILCFTKSPDFLKYIK